MKKKDLKDGMVVEIRGGTKFMVIKDSLINYGGFMDLQSYKDDLTLCNDNSNYASTKVYDIAKVYDTNDTNKLCEKNWSKMSCIWDREKEVDWSKIPIDTKVLVKDHEDNVTWLRRYFAKYEDGKIYVWSSGKTSWSGKDDDMRIWKCTKLYEDAENL